MGSLFLVGYYLGVSKEIRNCNYRLLCLASSYAGAQSPSDKKNLEELQQEGTKDILDWASVRAVSQLERRDVCVTCPPPPSKALHIIMTDNLVEHFI